MADILLSSNFLEAVPDAILAVDSAGTIVQINSQTEELFGYKREQDGRHGHNQRAPRGQGTH